MAPVVYLVTGANRERSIGMFSLSEDLAVVDFPFLGFAIVKAIIALDNTIVFAGVRNLKDRAALDELAAKSPNKIHVLKVVSADLENNKAAVEEIKRIAGRLDVVIANAGTAFGYKSSLETPLQDMQDHFTVNVVGTLALFQATYPLLKASTSTPKFVPISSTIGSIEKGTLFPTFQMPYGVSKAALNWLTVKLRNEHEGLGQHCLLYRYLPLLTWFSNSRLSHLSWSGCHRYGRWSTRGGSGYENDDGGEWLEAPSGQRSGAKHRQAGQ
jgi:NAD(P)-dependent dehydrogenase (short-subunit alcohol dehydrogenase family)